MAPARESKLSVPVLAWAGWVASEAEMRVGGGIFPAEAMPSSLRRRVTPVGRRALEAGWAVLAGRDPTHPRIVLSSRHGEYDRTLGLLRSLASEGTVSPAEFSLAVHHGLAGLLSIATGNHAGHTAIAAGADTLGSALIEAATSLAGADDQVLLIHFDEDLPALYQGVADVSGSGGVVALLLGNGGTPLRLGWQSAQPGNAHGAGSDCLLDILSNAIGSAEIGGDRLRWSLSAC